MYKIENYKESVDADNVRIFHGREVRKASMNGKAANGGGECVLHLSFASKIPATETDPEGWTSAEMKDYNGWGHDSGRPGAKDHSSRLRDSEDTRKSSAEELLDCIIVFISILMKETHLSIQKTTRRMRDKVQTLKPVHWSITPEDM